MSPHQRLAGRYRPRLPPAYTPRVAEISSSLSVPLSRARTRTLTHRLAHSLTRSSFIVHRQEPSDARGAIAVGLSLTDAGDYVGGLKYFEQALEMPGTGLKRYRDKPPLISEGEKMAALYNIACCQSQMAKTAAESGDDEAKEACIANGLVALAGALESGMVDFATVRGDADLDMLRGPKFDNLTGAFERKNRGLFGNLFGS